MSDTQSGGRIATFNPNGNARTVVPDLGEARGIGFDAADNLFYLTGTGTLQQVVGNGSSPVASGLNGPAFFHGAHGADADRRLQGTNAE